MEMAKSVDVVIVFWDGESLGTKNMIECAKLQGVPYEIV